MRDELDILKEVGTITAGHGSIVFSEILDKKISLNVPSVKFISPGELNQNISVGKTATATFSRIYKGFEGGGAFVLDGSSSSRLIDISYVPDLENKSVSYVVESGLSLLKDIGNVIVDSYLNALGTMFDRVIIPSVPTLINGTIDEILYLILSPYGKKNCACIIETIFAEFQENIKGSFYLILSSQGMNDVRDACKKLGQNE